MTTDDAVASAHDRPVGGAMGAFVRAHDWTSTAFGPAEAWPQSLRTAIDIVVEAAVPMALLWGPEGLLIYNDGYAVIAGDRHPGILGGPVLAAWPEAAAFNAGVLAAGLRGETTLFHDAAFALLRRGRPTEAWFDLAYSPVRDESGRPAGVLAVVIETTERVGLRRSQAESEAALRAREAELARAQAIGRVGGLEVDLVEGRNRRSPEYLAIHGLPPSFALESHETWLARIHPEDRGRAEAEFRKAVVTDAPNYAAEYRIVRPSDGAVRWIAARAEIERAADGRALRLVGAHQDITERREAEAALRESEARFRLIADSAPVPIWVSGPDGRRDFANRAYVDFLGLPYEAAIGVDWHERLHPDDRPRAETESRDGEAAGRPFTVEARHRRGDGAWRWMRSESRPRLDRTGARIGFIGVAHDVTAAREAEAILRDHNAALEAQVAERTRERDRVWRLARDLLVVVGAGGVFRAANPAWTAILGYAPAEVVGRHFRDFVWPEDLVPTEAALASAAAANDLTSFENRVRHRDGTPRWISWHTSVEGDLVYAYGRHVTQERAQAEALRETEEQLRQAQKMEAVGQLTGGIAHDFNNLLTGVIGSLDLMQTRLARGRTDGLERYMRAATDSANRAAALTHRLLAFARRQPLDPKPVDVNALVLSLEDLLRRTLGEAIRLELVLAADLRPTLCDPNQLENALLNLVINARDAMPGGGTLAVATANAALRMPTPGGIKPGLYVALSVTDTGAGMAPDVLARAIDPFFTTKPIGQGTGLGLSMVYGFARQSGGHLDLASEVGHGTTACLYLPRRRARIRDDGVEAAGEAPRAAAGETIVVVEDEPVVRDLIVEVLDDLGYRTLAAADGPSGLALLAGTETVDLLVTDIGLPGFNGRQLAEHARAARPDLRVLLMTGYAESAALTPGFLGPGTELITKPFTVDTLVARVRRMIGGG